MQTNIPHLMKTIAAYHTWRLIKMMKYNNNIIMLWKKIPDIELSITLACLRKENCSV